jgi:hypothetical protein
MDANMERPEKRQFDRNPAQMILANRGQYVAACLTIVRGYLAAGRPDAPIPLPSYGGWSDTVRGALMWLGYEDPVKSMEAINKLDPDRQELLQLLAAWHMYRASKACTLRELVDDAERDAELCNAAEKRLRETEDAIASVKYPDAAKRAAEKAEKSRADVARYSPGHDLFDAFRTITGDRQGVDRRKLGNWLRNKKDRIAGNYRLRQGDPDTHFRVERWWVEFA